MIYPVFIFAFFLRWVVLLKNTSLSTEFSWFRLITVLIGHYLRLRFSYSTDNHGTASDASLRDHHMTFIIFQSIILVKFDCLVMRSTNVHQSICMVFLQDSLHF